MDKFEEVNGDTIAMKNSFSMPNPFSTPGQTVGHEIYCTQAAY